MNKFLTSALALAATGTVGFADPDSSDWLELDSEINSLASTYASSGDGMGWTALLRFTYTYSSDDVATGNGGDDVSGFKFEDADMAFWGGVGSYQWRVSWDLANGFGGFLTDFTLEDAYVMWECEEYFSTTAGHYKGRILMSSKVDPEHQLFIDRSAIGSAFDFWDAGIELTGTQEMFDWYVGLQNGSNGQRSSHRYWVRGEYHFGTGAGMYEGALGANDDLNGTIGAVYYNDDTVSGDGSMFAFDLRGTSGPFGVGGEIAFIDEDLGNTLATSIDFSRLNSSVLFFGDNDDVSPFDVWISYLISDEFEAAVRYDDLDNSDDENILSVVVNWYRSGHRAKWQAQYSSIDSDGDDGSIFMISYSVGSTR